MKIKSFLIIVLLFNIIYTSCAFSANTAKKKKAKNTTKKQRVVKKKAAPSNAHLLNSLYTCSTYTRVTDPRVVQIIGWANRKCNYREIDSDYIYTCAFGIKQHQQLKNFVKAANNKSVVNNLVSIEGFDDMFQGSCKKTGLDGKEIEVSEVIEAAAEEQSSD